MLSTIFKGKTSSNESSASTGLWHLALNRLKSDRIAVVSFVIVLFYFILLALSMTGVIASNWNKEVAELAKQHNNANMISIPARYVSKEEALEIAQAFLNAEFEGV